MRKLLLATAAGFVLTSSAGAQEMMSSPAAIAQAVTLNAASLDILPTKTVPRQDKAAIDIIGTVYSVQPVANSQCGGTPLGAAVVFVNVYSTGSPLRYIGIGCAGSTLASCSSLRPGQRVRIQGTAVLMPDFMRPDFDPCNPDTWFLPEVATFNVLVATKVTR